MCLGHQALAEAYGGRTVRSPEPMHGRSSEVRHGGQGVLAGLPSPFAAGRYHSLLAEPGPVLRPTAWAGDLVMAMRHPEHPHEGVQFHPESLLTEGGHRMIETFVRGCG